MAKLKWDDSLIELMGLRYKNPHADASDDQEAAILRGTGMDVTGLALEVWQAGVLLDFIADGLDLMVREQLIKAEAKIVRDLPDPNEVQVWMSVGRPVIAMPRGSECPFRTGDLVAVERGPGGELILRHKRPAQGGDGVAIAGAAA